MPKINLNYLIIMLIFLNYNIVNSLISDKEVCDKYTVFLHQNNACVECIKTKSLIYNRGKCSECSEVISNCNKCSNEIGCLKCNNNYKPTLNVSIFGNKHIFCAKENEYCDSSIPFPDSLDQFVNELCVRNAQYTGKTNIVSTLVLILVLAIGIPCLLLILIAIGCCLYKKYKIYNEQKYTQNKYENLSKEKIINLHEGFCSLCKKNVYKEQNIIDKHEIEDVFHYNAKVNRLVCGGVLCLNCETKQIQNLKYGNYKNCVYCKNQVVWYNSGSNINLRNLEVLQISKSNKEENLDGSIKEEDKCFICFKGSLDCVIPCENKPRHKTHKECFVDLIKNKDKGIGYVSVDCPICRTLLFKENK